VLHGAPLGEFGIIAHAAVPRVIADLVQRGNGVLLHQRGEAQVVLGKRAVRAVVGHRPADVADPVAPFVQIGILVNGQEQVRTGRVHDVHAALYLVPRADLAILVHVHWRIVQRHVAVTHQDNAHAARLERVPGVQRDRQVGLLLRKRQFATQGDVAGAPVFSSMPGVDHHQRPVRHARGRRGGGGGRRRHRAGSSLGR